MKRIFVAVPAYTGSVTVETVESLQAEQVEAFRRKHGFAVCYKQQDPIIHRCRNYLVQTFLETDYTDLVFLDSDVGFPMGTLCRLAEHPVDIVGALYPRREEPTSYPVRWIEDRPFLEANEHGLLEVDGIPTGCLRISRRAVEKMVEAHKDDFYLTGEGKKNYPLFDFVRRNGILYGEDYTFCHKAREAGFGIWLDPEIDMTHTGHKVYHGNVGAWLKSRTEEQREAA